MADYLLPIADREPLRWIVHEQRTAFAEHRAADAARLEPGDRVFLYTTRGCFRNPTRDRGRVIACASVAAPARRLEAPIRFGGREYPNLVELEIDTLAPLRQGLELAPLVPRLAETFPDPRSWSVRMRRALVPLAPSDADLIAEVLAAVARPYREARSTYDELAAEGSARRTRRRSAGRASAPCPPRVERPADAVLSSSCDASLVAESIGAAARTQAGTASGRRRRRGLRPERLP